MSNTTQEWLCGHCGATCSRKAVRGQKPKWCSKACAWAEEKRRMAEALSKDCAECGRTFTPADRRTELCSRACVGAHIKRSRPPKPVVEPKPPVDLRSPLRKAWEARDWDALAVALKMNSERVDDCWVWQGRVDSKGYPGASIGKWRVGAHRLGAMVGVRRELGSEAAHHTCANPLCVNPDHVVPASAIENVAEMKARRGYEARIRELEGALREVAPGHPALGVLPIY